MQPWTIYIGGTARRLWVTAAVPLRYLVPCRHSDVEALLGKRLSDILEPLVLRDGDRSRIDFTLQLARRMLEIGLHQLLDGSVDRHQRPGVLRVVVHEDVVAFLRILPQIEDLRYGGRIDVRPFPSKVRVD